MAIFFPCFLSFLILATTSLYSNTNTFPWQEYKPGGDTKCAHGEEFSFFVHHGDPKRLVIDFFGGGACWNGENCKENSKIYSKSVTDWSQRKKAGVYDHQNPKNPYKDWTHVLVPYCTGDIHWGETDAYYEDKKGNQFLIHHRGATNTKAALKWAQQAIPNPEQIVATGCSAGAYASIYWTPHIAEQYPTAQIVQFGDSGSGVLTDSFIKNDFNKWNPTANAPHWIPELDPAFSDWSELKLSDMYSKISRYYPYIKFSQYNSLLDYTQQAFFSFMGGNPLSWGKQVVNTMRDITEETENFRYFLNKDIAHCATFSASFYKRGHGKHKLHTWLSEFIKGGNVASISP